MKTTIAITAALALTACGADTFVSAKDGATKTDAGEAGEADANDPPDDAPSDTRADNIVDSPVDAPADSPVVDANAPCDGGPQLWGATGCNAIMDAFCTTTYNKCGGMTLQQCRAWWASNFPNEFDCNANKFKAQGCNDYASKCANVEIPSYACGKLQSSTPSQLGGACASWFAEF